MKLLDDTEDWLYGEGEDETKTVYQERLAEMKVHVCWRLLEGGGGVGGMVYWRVGEGWVGWCTGGWGRGWVGWK